MKILYVDDDATNRTVLREMLAMAGVAMAEAADASTGLRLIDQQDFDIILMDLRMPNISGLTAIRQLRARSDAKGRMPILVVTADLTPGVRDMCQSAGATEFLAKPVGMDQLFNSIGSAIAGAEGVRLN